MARKKKDNTINEFVEIETSATTEIEKEEIIKGELLEAEWFVSNLDEIRKSISEIQSDLRIVHEKLDVLLNQKEVSEDVVNAHIVARRYL